MGRVVIVAEDDTALSELLAPRLAGAGQQCVVVNAGVRAFEGIKQARPDVVLLDLLMSEVSAFRLCRMIRKDSLLYTVPIMVLSDAEDEPELSYCMELGADDYLVKPIVMKKLMGKVQELLQLGEAAVKRDSVTGMLGMEGIKRVINHRLARGKTIAACYIGVPNLRVSTGGAAIAAADMDELVKELAQLTYRVAAESNIHELLAAYVGAVYFVVMVNADEYERFCGRLVGRFDAELLWRWKLHHVNGNSRRGTVRQPAPKLSIGVVHNQHRKYRNADEMFRSLAEVHREAEKSSTTSYFACRRRFAH